MKQNIKALLFFAFSILAIALSQAGEMRVWDSSKGSKINAELLFMGETLIVLKTDKGKELSIPITSLGPESVAYLKQLREKSEDETTTQDQTDKSTKPKVNEDEMEEEKPAADEKIVAVTDTLATLSDGPGTGMHAYYEGDKYIAELNKNGFLSIYHKDKDGKADRRWRMLVRAKSMLSTKSGWKHFEYVKILTGSPAKKDAEQVEFTFQNETGIVSQVIFEFEPDGFTTWTRSENGSSTPEGTLHLMSHHILNLNQVSKDKSYLSQIILKHEKVNGEKEKYDFNESVTLSGDTQECEITGPFLDKTKIQIKRARDSEAKLTPAQYPGASLSKGFAMNCIKTDSMTKKHNSEKTTVTFK